MDEGDESLAGSVVRVRAMSLSDSLRANDGLKVLLDFVERCAGPALSESLPSALQLLQAVLARSPANLGDMAALDGYELLGWCVALCTCTLFKNTHTHAHVPNTPTACWRTSRARAGSARRVCPFC